MAEPLHSVVSALDHFQALASSRNNLIPLMDWEVQLGGTLNLSKDQLRFILAMFTSVFVGWGIRCLKSPTLRHLYSLVTGVALTYFPFGAGIIHALPPIILTYLAMMAAPRSCGPLAWAANFPYLIYLHVMNASGVAWMQGQMDFTGCEMVLVLKLISVAYCYQDGKTKKKEDMTAFQASHALDKVPSFFEYLSFTFSLGNLLSGPYFEYSEYKDFIELKGVWDPKLLQSKPAPNALMPTLTCLAETGFFMFAYIRLLPIFNVGTFKQSWYNNASVLQKCVIMHICGLTNQFKYCFTWKLSETSLTLAGLNFNGWNEKTGKPEWGRCRNVRFFHMQFCDTARMITFYWNIGTGMFLRRYVYERLVAKGKKPGFAQLFTTQMVSAIWHGLYPGYLLFFAATALWIFFSTQLYKIEQKYFPVGARSIPARAVKIVWTQFVLCYMATAFMVLDLKGSLEVYASIYYFPHVLILLGCFLLPPFAKGSHGKRKGSMTADKTTTDKAKEQ